MRKTTVFKATLLLFLLSQGSPASFAQQDESATRTTPYRMALFPSESEMCRRDVGPVVRRLQTSVENNRASVLAYSYHDDKLNKPRITNHDRLWVGGLTQKQPNFELVYKLARERDIDGVVMAWGKCDPGTWYTLKPNPLWVYVIDIERSQVYREKGTTKLSSVTKLANKMLAAFVEGRGEKLDIASISEAQTPAQVEEKTRATPYRIGVFPFEAIGMPGSYQIGLVTDDTADALQTFVDGHPSLVLTYSYFDRMLNEPRLRKVNKLWAGDRAKKKPVVSLVSAAGHERNVDGVLMCWLKIPTNYGYGASTWVPAEVYLIDVASRKVYRAKGDALKAHVLLDEVVSQFLKDHPKVVP